MGLDAVFGTRVVQDASEVFEYSLGQKPPEGITPLNGYGRFHFGGNSAWFQFKATPAAIEKLVKSLEMKDDSEMLSSDEKGQVKGAGFIYDKDLKEMPWWNLKYQEGMKHYRYYNDGTEYNLYYYPENGMCFIIYSSTH